MVKREIRSQIMELFDGPTLSVLATVSRRGRPWTRYVMSRIDGDLTLRIPTRSSTRKVGDIQHFPFVHVLVGKNLFERGGAYAQIEGRASLTQNAASLGRFWYDGMTRFFSGPDDPSYLLIEVRPERIEYWSMSEAENPHVLEEEDLAPVGLPFDDELSPNFLPRGYVPT